MTAWFVSAVLKRGVRDDLEGKLRSGVLEAVTPFGPALQAALWDARCGDDGRICFEHPCFELPALQAERDYTLDWYLSAITCEAVEAGEGWRRIAGLPRLFPAAGGAPRGSV